MSIYNLIMFAEKCILFFIALLTVFSVGAEMYVVIQNGKIALTDLLLMFIFAEVLGMLAAFYSKQRNLITLPLFIAMTALSRLIVLQSKETEPVVLLYESCAILLIAIACWVISRMRSGD